MEGPAVAGGRRGLCEKRRENANGRGLKMKVEWSPSLSECGFRGSVDR